MIDGDIERYMSAAAGTISRLRCTGEDLATRIERHRPPEPVQGTSDGELALELLDYVLSFRIDVDALCDTLVATGRTDMLALVDRRLAMLGGE